MALLIRIFILFAILCTGYSFKCYMCNSEKLYGCAKNQKPTEHECGTLPDDKRFFCIYVVSHNIPRNITYTNSSCLPVQKGTLLDKMIVPQCKSPPKDTKIVECGVCQRELCNIATLPNASLLAYFPLIFLLSFFTR